MIVTRWINIRRSVRTARIERIDNTTEEMGIEMLKWPLLRLSRWPKSVVMVICWGQLRRDYTKKRYIVMCNYRIENILLFGSISRRNFDCMSLSILMIFLVYFTDGKLIKVGWDISKCLHGWKFRVTGKNPSEKLFSNFYFYIKFHATS